MPQQSQDLRFSRDQLLPTVWLMLAKTKQKKFFAGYTTVYMASNGTHRLRRATQSLQREMFVFQPSYECAHTRDQRPSHPQSNISGRAARQPGNRFANFPQRLQLQSSTTLLVLSSKPPRVEKKNKKKWILRRIRVWCPLHGTGLPLERSQVTITAEEWNNPSFSPTSVGLLGVTRHLAVAVHWLSLLGTVI